MKEFIQPILDGPKRALALWDQFFFAPVSPISIGVFRAVFGFIAFVMYSIRFINWKYYFGTDGFLPASGAVEILPDFYKPWITWFPTNPQMIVPLSILFLISLLVLTVGYYSRVAAFIALALHIAFIQRNYAIAYGADFISTFFFFGLLFPESDRAFSLKAYLGKVKPERSGSLNQFLNTIGLRLIQIHLCIVYTYTGLEKMKGNSWWDGTAVWAVIGNPQLLMFDLSWLKSFPVIIALMTYLTLFFEIYFSALVWFKPTRKWILLLGLALHGGIGLMIGLIFFSSVMLSAYFTFVDPDWLRSQLIRARVPSQLLA